MNYIITFLVGGAICAVVQIIMDNTKLLPGRIMVGLVCAGAILSFFQLYEPFSQWGRAGATVPLIGFGHLLYKGVKEAVDNQGFIGTFYGGFESAAVGIAGALIIGYLASLVFKSKMK
ncbi:MAG: SpoVA/SpoVAEb family sporulation membrane protein [Lachnospiraceae bacterium]|nr:SpoVA/SpoVAEb family sporulation membrane protein [Lachnospiraceae bacterium]